MDMLIYIVMSLIATGFLILGIFSVKDKVGYVIIPLLVSIIIFIINTIAGFELAINGVVNVALVYIFLNGFLALVGMILTFIYILGSMGDM